MRFSFHTNHNAIRANSFGQQVHDSNGSTTDIDGPKPGLEIDAIEHPLRGPFKALRLCNEPLLFCLSAAEHIWNGWRRHAATPQINY
jgi:hypothetical protein